jgi:hypothetical protein
MTSKKMSETIKDVLVMTDSLLGRPATRGQVIQVIELIESFNQPEKTPKAATQTKTVRKVKSKTSKKRRKTYNSWNNEATQAWFAAVLNGKDEIIDYSEMSVIAPSWDKITYHALRERFNIEASRRNLKLAEFVLNKQEQYIFVRTEPVA